MRDLWVRYRTGVLTGAILTGFAVVLAGIDFDPEDPVLGDDFVSVRDAEVAGRPVRDNARPILAVLDELPTRDADRSPIIWVGNSHQHAINSAEPGDTVSSVYLHRSLNGETYPGEFPAFGISYPNLRFEEQFLLTLALVLREPERRPLVIVHGVRFHDVREMGVRSYLRPLFKVPAVMRWLDDPPALSGARAEALDRLQNDRAAAQAATRKEEGLEAWMVANVGPKIPIFHNRTYIYSRIRRSTRGLRDWVFRIDTTDKRPILKSRYTHSVAFLDLAVEIAKDHGVEVLLYNSPLRQEAENPYVPSEYLKFRGDLAAIADRNGAQFRDYDELIPRDLWGTWHDLPDYSHFTSAGHRLLADQVQQDLEPLLGADPGRVHEHGNDALQ